MSNKFIEAVGYEVFQETPNLNQIATSGSLRPDINRGLQNQVIQIGGFLDKIRNAQDKTVEDDIALFVESQKAKFNLQLAETPDWNTNSDNVQGVLTNYDSIVAQASLDYLEQNRNRMSNDQYTRAYTKLSTQIMNGMVPYTKELGIAKSKEGVAREVAQVEGAKTNIENSVIQAPITGQGLNEEDITTNVLSGLNVIKNSPYMTEGQKQTEMLGLVKTEHNAFLQSDITDNIVNDIAGKYYGTDKDGNRVINYEQKLKDLEKTKELAYNNEVIKRDAQKYYYKYGKKYGLTEEDFTNMIYQQNSKFMQEAYPKIYNQVVKAQDNDLQKQADREMRRFQQQQSAFTGLDNQLAKDDFLTPISNASGQNFNYSDVFANGLKYKDITREGKAVPLYSITHNIDNLEDFRAKGGYVQMPEAVFAPIKTGIKNADTVEQMDSSLSSFYMDATKRFGAANKEMMKKSMAQSTKIPLEIINVNDPQYKQQYEESGNEGQQIKDNNMKQLYLTANQMGVDFRDKDYALKAPLQKLGSYSNVMGILSDAQIGLTPQEMDVLIADMINKNRINIPKESQDSNRDTLTGVIFSYVNKSPEALEDLKDSRDQILRLRKQPSGEYRLINKDRIRNNANSQILLKYPLSADETRPEINPIVENSPANSSTLSAQQKLDLKNRYKKNGGI